MATKRRRGMLKLWSELPGARANELAADAGTVLWVALWIAVSRRLYDTLAAFSGTGRFIRSGGQNLDAAGRQIGAALGGVPVIGQGVGELVRLSMGFAARPFLSVGTSLEHIFLLIASLFSVIVLVVAVAPWLYRYVQWRGTGLRKLWAADRVIRTSPGISGTDIERLLASRALHRLSYQALLRYSPDPFGDWTRGRYGRLAQAELASVGLRPSGRLHQP